MTANFPQTCQTCHDTANWMNATFNHNSTGFPLTGLHTVPPRACTDCHVNNNYNLNSTACATCHLKDYQGTTNPNHVTANFPQTCDQCHSTSTWLNATFNHDSTGFPLTGLHTVPPRACTDCHVNNNYNLNSTACVTCHLKDYQGTTNPNHVTANFPQTCDQCHNTSTWLNATFNHDSTGFPLTGLHTVPPRACTDCHVNNNYNLNSTACVTCHLKDYQGTTNPNHVTANFPQTCNQCHTTSTWLNATFNHDSTGFPLTGLHTVPPRACTDCHVNNNYNLNSTACVTCHLKDYQGTTNPEPRHGEFPADLQPVPQHQHLAQCHVQSQQHRIPAHRIAHRSAARLHRLPRQQQLQPQHRGLRELPPEGFPGNDQSQSRHCEFPADLRTVPQY